MYRIAVETSVAVSEIESQPDLVWTEAYPALQFRHGPISIGQPDRLTSMLGCLRRGSGKKSWQRECRSSSVVGWTHWRV